MNKEYLVSIEALEDLEKRLNDSPFFGTPSGTLIAGFLLVELYLGKSNFSLKGKIADILLREYIKYYGPQWQRKNKHGKLDEYSKYSDRHLLTVTDKRANFKGLIIPIINCLNNDEYVVFASQDSIDASMSNVISYNDIPSIPLAEWRKKIIPYISKWNKIVAEWIADYSIQKWTQHKIMSNLYSQTLLLESLRLFLQKVKPKSITTEYDRYWFSSALVAAGNSLSIPTYTLMHGVVNNSISYIPLLANNIIVWGNRQKEQLVAYGLNPDRIIVKGAPHLSDNIAQDKQTVRSHMGFTDAKPVVIFGSCNISVNDMHSLMSMFCKAFNDQDQFHAIVKLHPIETKEFYKEEISNNTNIRFCDTEELGFEDSFALADVICVYNSAYGTDALIKGIPVVVMDINIAKAGNASELISNGIPACTNAQAVYSTCHRLVSDTSYRIEIQDKMTKYRKIYCFAFGNNAAVLYADTIRNYRND